MAELTKLTGNESLDKKLQDWNAWNRDAKLQAEVDSLIANNEIEKLEKMFMKRLPFGTAGIRGRMGPGFSQMNDLIIIQTSQGLIEYVADFHNTTDLAIVIGYDGRHNSKRWAELSASIFLKKGAKVYLFSDVCPTPLVAFAVTRYDADAGVMITASHNPKEDNGYKVYWNNGVQIISPHDNGIFESIMKHLAPLPESWNIQLDSKNLEDPMEDILTEYSRRIKATLITSIINKIAPLRITYTAMHGVGYPFVCKLFKTAQLPDLFPVEEQIKPDPDFPTVAFPNPEEGQSALDLAIKTAEENSSDIILANDPDADRLAVAERSQDGEWRIFTGNEIGALLCWWLIYSLKMRNPIPSYKKVYTLSSAVSSKIGRSISLYEGFSHEETLTGFKWMGNRAAELQKDGNKILFAFEEAIGFMCRDVVLDKDGISAAVHMGELVSFLYSRRDTLTIKLIEIYRKYGHHLSNNSYFICEDQQKIKSIFDRLNHFVDGKENTFPTSIMNGKYNIQSVRDLNIGYDSAQPDLKAVLPSSKSSYMITFTFENGCIATLRTSGTEPKLKYYTEIRSSERELVNMKNVFNEMVTAIIEEFLEPAKNGLIPRSS